MMRRRRKIFPI